MARIGQKQVRSAFIGAKSALHSVSKFGAKNAGVIATAAAIAAPEFGIPLEIAGMAASPILKTIQKASR